VTSTAPPRRVQESVGPAALVGVLTRLAWETGRLAVAARRVPDDALLIRATYRALLGREPDPSGVAYLLAGRAAGQLPRRGIVLHVLRSPEFALRRSGLMPPGEALHRARLLLIQQRLPPGEVVVDLGGTAPQHPQRSALLLMGYPHRPRHLLVVDLALAPEDAGDVTTPEGIRITRLRQSMAEPLPLADASVDLVVAGETIEHVTADQAARLCREARRVLKPGGSFCLDTPNAALTRLESPDALIHPDHKVEYRVEELRAVLDGAGLRVVEACALCPMPASLRTGRFDPRELIGSIGLGDDPETGYLFYLRAVKP
jgi:SAM-dependent methyltransferase